MYVFPRPGWKRHPGAAGQLQRPGRQSDKEATVDRLALPVLRRGLQQTARNAALIVKNVQMILENRFCRCNLKVLPMVLVNFVPINFGLWQKRHLVRGWICWP